MRKISLWIVCLLVISSMILPVFAAGSAHMSVSASNATLYRGDTVSFTVSISSVPGCKSAGFVASYDQSVFEWVSGSCLVSGFIADFSGGTGSVAFAQPTDIGGGLFSFTLKVKDSAPFGSYTVSGRPSINDADGPMSGSAGGAAVTIACRHEYGAAVKTDDANHKRVCVHCGDESTSAHGWQDVSVDKAAACNAPGSKTVKCADCGFTATQQIPATNNHSYGGWSQVNSSTHSHTCSVCGKQESDYHTWNEDTVNKAATCKEVGSKTVKCIGCGYTKEAEIPLAEHTYDAMQRVDAATHTHTCTVCGNRETLEHTFSETWASDSDGHHLVCTDCGEKKDRSAHIPGPAATQDTPQLCTVCSYTLMPELSHAHTYKEAWDTDDNAHWHACESCIITKDWQEHSYETVCANACSVCGKERQAPHEPLKEFTADETGHWYACGLCGEKLEFTAHTPGPEATISSAQKCTVCEFVIKPVLPHDHVYDAAQDHWHACACGERYSADPAVCEICYEPPFPWWIVCAAEAAVFGGVIVLLLVLLGKKKK